MPSTASSTVGMGSTRSVRIHCSVAMRSNIDGSVRAGSRWPHSADTGPGDPDELLVELERIRREGRQTLARLKQELAAALGGESA